MMTSRLLILLTMGFAMTACSPDLMAGGAPPPPPIGARATVEEGPQEQRLDEVVLEIRDALQDKARPLEIETYRLPVGTAWPTVRDHYGASLDWPRDVRLPDRLRGAEARAWRKGDRVFAVALIDQPVPGAEGLVQPLLVVAHAD